MLPKEPPRYVAEAIRRYDHKLRIRWSREKKKFVVERKVDVRSILIEPVKTIGIDENGKDIKVRCPEYSDRYIQYHDGYFKVIETPEASERLLNWLWESDALRHGKHYLAKLEEAEKKRLDLEKRREAGYLQDVSGESYDFLQYRQGERVSFGGMKNG